MGYQVIARKYRPQRFSDVVGQDHVVRTLTNAIQHRRIAHAYLFSGPRGTGKTTVARIFAKCLNCQDGPRVDFSDDDPWCREIAESRSLDVLEIDGASNRGIEEIRELRETARYAPAASRYKIYIIDEVHMLTKEAFNALLKTLEEPPEHVKFMFATTEPDKVLPTILSRCQRFDLRRIPVSVIVSHLRHIAEKEDVEIGEEALQAIARGAEGGMRDAESALDQLISFCGRQIGEEEVLSMFGLTARDQIFELAGAILSGEREAVLQRLNHLAEGGKDLGRLLADLLNHFRNLLLYQVSEGDPQLLEVTESELNALKEQAEGLTATGLTRIMEVLTRSERQLRDAASKRIVMEVSLLQALEARNAVDLDTLLQQVAALRDGLHTDAESSSPAPAPKPESAAQTNPETPPKRSGSSSGTKKAARTSPATKKSAASKTPATETNVSPDQAPVTQSTASQSASSPSDLQTLWQQLVRAAAQASPFLKNYLLEAHPVSFAKNTLTIGFDPECSEHIGLVDNKKNHSLLKSKLEELGYPDVRLRFTEAERPADFTPPTLPETGPARQEAPTQDQSASESERAAADTAAAAEGQEASPQPTTDSPAPEASGPVTMDKEAFKNDPLIQQALEIFKGEIVDVRKS